MLDGLGMTEHHTTNIRLTYDCLLHGKGRDISWETEEGDSYRPGNLMSSI